jgi:hypothetical protein
MPITSEMAATTQGRTAPAINSPTRSIGRSIWWVDDARGWKADLILIGSHGRRGIGRLLAPGSCVLPRSLIRRASRLKVVFNQVEDDSDVKEAFDTLLALVAQNPVAQVCPQCKPCAHRRIPKIKGSFSPSSAS